MVLLAAASDRPALHLDPGAARVDLVDRLDRSTAQVVQQPVIGGDLRSERAGMTGHGGILGRGWLRALFDLVQGVGFQAVRLAMDARGRLAVRSVD